jgi:hypothetical protein
LPLTSNTLPLDGALTNRTLEQEKVEMDNGADVDLPNTITRDLQITRWRPSKIYVNLIIEYPYVFLALFYYMCYESKRGLNG